MVFIQSVFVQVGVQSVLTRIRTYFTECARKTSNVSVCPVVKGEALVVHVRVVHVLP